MLVPRAIVPGHVFQARAIVRCQQPLPVKSVDVELVGTCVWYTRSQYGKLRNDEVFHRSIARVCGKADFAAKDHGFPVQFELPEDVPATYLGEDLEVEYAIHVHVSIPWWPDARASFIAFAGARYQPEPERQRSVYTSGADSLEDHRPYAELSLGSTTLYPGETLRGAVALANVAYNNYRGVDIQLIAVEEFPAFLGSSRHHRRTHKWSLEVAATGEAEAIRFALQMPDSVVPGFACGRCQLAWFLEVRVDVAWSPDLRMWVPVEIGGLRAGEQLVVPAPLAVGSERLDLVWREAAAQTGFTFSQGQLVKTDADTKITISREHHGRRGVVLAGHLEFPDLGVGLRAGPNGLCARDPEHAARVGEAVELGEAAMVTEVSDTGIWLERADGGLRLEPLIEQARVLAQAAEAIARLRYQLPAPRCMVAMVPAWERAARLLSGRLLLAPMIIVSQADDMAIEVRTDWDTGGQPSRTVFELRPANFIDHRHRIVWRAGDTLAPLEAADLPLETIGDGARALAIDATRIRVFLAGPLQDPATEIDRISALVHIGQKLSGRAGLYR